MSNVPVEYPYPLQGKLALITGCTGGIGQATARAFARSGCSIALHHSSAKSKAKADALIAELVKLAPGVRAAAFEADLSTYENARKLCDQVVEVLGHPDILFSNHGVTGPKIGPQGDMQEVSAEAFEDTWRTNAGTGYVVRTTFAIRHVLSHFAATSQGEDSHGADLPIRRLRCSLHRNVCRTCKRRSGGASSLLQGVYFVEMMCGSEFCKLRPIFSVAAGTGGVIGPQYASSKSALHGLIHWLSLRYCKEGIVTDVVTRFAMDNFTDREHLPQLTNGVAPALIEDTEMMANPTDAVRSLIPIGRLGKPEEIASIVLMLVTNGYMTNKILVADGGWTNGGGF